MRIKTILKGQLREKHARARGFVKNIVVPPTKQAAVKEEPVETDAKEEPVATKRPRKAQVRKSEVPAAVEDLLKETSENNE